MSQLHFYVPDRVENTLRIKAKQANMPLSRYIAEIVKREVQVDDKWPDGYFELFDKWEGEPQSRPGQLELETRLGFD